MTATATRIPVDHALRTFYTLRITGLPYVFTGVVNPYSTSWTSPWTTPSGYTILTGLVPPDGWLTQRAPSIIGGIATAESLDVEIIDQATRATGGGERRLVSQLFAAGRTSTMLVGYLTADITAAATTGDTFDVAAPAATAFAATGDLYVGGETIGYSAVSSVSGTFTFTIAARNKYPCSSAYPKAPRHAVRDGRMVPVCTGSGDIIGRTAALYIGHLDPTGQPCTEAEALLRIVGRIRSAERDARSVSWRLEVESVMSDLEKVRVAPGLAKATLAPDMFVIRAGINDSFAVGESGIARTEYTIAAGTYTKQSLVAAVNAKLSTNSTLMCAIGSYGKFMFRLPGIGVTQLFSSMSGQPGGLLESMGFDLSSGAVQFAKDQTVNGYAIAVAAEAVQAAIVKWPSATVPLAGTTTGQGWFTDQGDGSREGYLRFADGSIHAISSVTSTSISLGASYIPGVGNGIVTVTQGTGIEQIIVTPPPSIVTTTHILRTLGRFLASGTTGVTDTTWNVYPDGVGLGLLSLMDTDSWDLDVGERFQRTITVDSNTTLGELLTPVLQEHGLLCAWDPAQGKIVIRRMEMPCVSLAETYRFTDANRPAVDDMTTCRRDQQHLVSSWKLEWGWLTSEARFAGQAIAITDGIVTSLGLSDKGLEISDKSIGDAAIWSAANRSGDLRDQLIKLISERMNMTRWPWVEYSRGVNRTGMLLCPGTVHLVTDATAQDPYTGGIGITVASGVYSLLLETSSQLSTGETKIVFVVNPGSHGARTWSPSALVNFDFVSNGYNNTTGVVSLAQYYTASTNYDGVDFAVGDLVRFIPRNTIVGAELAWYVDSTISAVAANGSTVTVAAGLGAFPTDSEVVMILQPYAAATATRQATIAWLANGDSLEIASGVSYNEWG